MADPVAQAIYNFLRALRDFFGSLFAWAIPSPPPVPEDRVTLRRTETTTRLCAYVILARPDGTQAVRIGPQPDEGFRIDEATVARLGGPGASVLVCDGPLETTITLPPPR